MKYGYAAALSIIGWLFLKEENIQNKQIDFEVLSHISIWIAHSSDDNDVSIVSDDYMYKKLKETNTNIKYTRWDKYGHSMSLYFLSKEPWADWLFSQHK